jgi:hypothetical protein
MIKPYFLNCPRDTTVCTSGSATCAVYAWPPTLPQDNCGIASTQISHRYRECFEVGKTTIVTLSIRDLSNNFTVCSFKVTAVNRPNCTTKVSEHDNRFSKIQLKPNPTEKTLFVEFDSQINGSVQFSFYDAIGRAVSTEQRLVKIGSNVLEFSVHDFAAGLYWLMPTIEGKTLGTLRFVKL